MLKVTVTGDTIIVVTPEIVANGVIVCMAAPLGGLTGPYGCPCPDCRWITEEEAKGEAEFVRRYPGIL